MTFQDRKEAQYKMLKIMTKIYKTHEKIEETTNKKILVFEENFVSYKNYKGFGLKQKPFLFGDTFYIETV